MVSRRRGARRVDDLRSAGGRESTSIVKAVVVGMAVMLAGTIPRNVLFAANLRYAAGFPWAVPAMAIYLFYFWRYLRGGDRRQGLRANQVSATAWAWAMVAGVLGIVALVLALHLVNRFVALPPQKLPDLAGVPKTTVLSLLLMAAPVAGIVEEAAFRGYMQGAIERRYGIVLAVLVTGTMFAVAHLDFTPVLWPYYVAVAALYGMVTYMTNSILPSIVLHTAGNLYSNLDLWLNGRAEWQAGGAEDLSTASVSLGLAVAALLCATGFLGLSRATRTAGRDKVAPGA
jgi:membrane protease YdiL (CAAX protease family)